mmetsp:Transcript_34445/g.51935  ORF Transcript_34445/g.51935 Transcript_34445/m.51935 type:complete len:141 (+) Transcript_34445:42-464(+)
MADIAQPVSKEEDNPAVAETALLAQKIRAKDAQKRILDDKLSQLKRLRNLDKDEEEQLKKLKRKVNEVASTHAVEEGKKRSSDVFFHFIHQDRKEKQYTKELTLGRARSVSSKQIDLMKGEIRDMVKQVIRDDGDGNSQS